MALPDLIEIVPLDKPVRAEITVPGSKSITNRALILAALADGEVTLTGALWSEDTQVMTEALRTLGFDVRVENDPAEFCNRTITVNGLGGNIPKAGTPEKPLELFVGNAGTAARFLAAMVCLGNGVYRLHGVPRMHERPQAALFKALRELGYRVESANDKLPAVIHGQVRSAECGVRSCTVSIDESSQFASALFLSARHGNWDIKVVGDDDEEAPYVQMTQKLVEVFPWNGGSFQIEPDASSGSYFWGANWLARSSEWFLRMVNLAETSEANPKNFKQTTIIVTEWPITGWQIDARFTGYFADASRLPSKISRKFDLGDSIMTAIVIASAEMISERRSTVFANLGRLRLQECERVFALRTELTKCGARIIETGDNLRVFYKHLHGAEIETYNDHRMAMCFAILGLKVPGIKLKNPACVKKTFPNFFQKLAAPPPNGLGVEIRDGRTGRKLEMDELFAD
ncbi:MAG: 3-phosphoshikimate 1-carboxyvinyltransferase [Verrucomicrobia bacterium]|nr:3-phosphoshikimate 1-carboxyvinyltransferase [Verrucomicrobiota bacterium]